MKKYFIGFAAALVLCSAATITADGQLSGSNGHRNEIRDPAAPLPESLANGSAGINRRVLKDLTKNFKEMSGENWYKTSYGFVVKFNSNHCGCRVDYDKKGNRLYAIRTYNEGHLPEEVRQSVKAAYYEYTIALVQEIEMPRKNFTYIIHLDGKSDLINLRVHDGEMDELQAFEKSKSGDSYTSNNHK